MEFRIDIKGEAPDLEVVGDVVGWLDAAVVVDFSQLDSQLRIATSLSQGDLLAALVRAGLVLAPDAIIQLPSVCCGGCSG